MYKLILADETVLYVGMVGTYDDGPLYIDVTGKTFAECAMIFSDATKTAHMVYDTTLEQMEYDGYTALTAMKLENGYIKVTMRKAT